MGKATKRTVTIRDVAAAADVAVGTVSRVLNDHHSVTKQVRERVQKTILTLGYQRNAIAQSMRSSRTKMVACAIRDFDIPAFASYVKAAEATFRSAGYTFILASTANAKDVELSLLQTFSQRRVDGVMMTMSDETDPDLVNAITHGAMPIVLIDRELVQSVDSVSADHRAGARQATEYLLSLGHRRIALLVGDPKAYPSRSRIEGYTEAHRSFGVPVDSYLIRDRLLSNEATFRETAALLGRSERPTAIYAAGLDTLPGPLRAVRTAGLVVGQDISIISGNDSDLAELNTPPITALRWDRSEMGRHAAEILLDRIDHGRQSPPRRIRLPVSLVVRGSCRPV
ncbi:MULTISPECIES: LacI family DNA-binding transcriptional regulator [Bradyrhizobium]|uniref:LacI family DNA-binding transcriptional regulator n=1 Tax=Bradyrhizobium frederickii TaxID=2560054 RepID=A0A4Y9L6G7_9BRAD|nr:MULTISPECIES: LacI family DNA-binding transcriptional regulator [Bradyrhizobium]RTE92202.1 LacI family DNA-binding transcriptional regulator [Bradyrhizobium sp. LVM 105]TFV37633.1 LacI family DNA-binding transcriptional regulator [Bradyrhizobium frederickii]